VEKRSGVLESPGKILEFFGSKRVGTLALSQNVVIFEYSHFTG